MITTPETPAAYGSQMARYFRLSGAPSLIIPFPSKPKVAITRLTNKDGLLQQTSQIPSERSFVVSVHLSPASDQGCEIWANDNYSRVTRWPIGGIGIYDLEADPRWRNRGPVDWVHYHIPRATLDSFVDDLEVVEVGNLQCEYGTFDEVLYQLTQLVLPSLNAQQLFCELFLDHFRLLLCSHLTHRYAASFERVKIFRGGLAPWQKRRVDELLKVNLDGEIGLADLAHECGLSISHFTRSFRRTFGTSAHRYLILQRIEHAKSLLSNSTAALTDVALQAGFSDQASFTHAFKGVVGIPPGHWRRRTKAISIGYSGGLHDSCLEKEQRWSQTMIPLASIHPRAISAAVSVEL